MVVLFPRIAYMLAEALEPGIVSVLFCGIVMGHTPSAT